MDFADYENLSRLPSAKEVPLKVKIRALLNRAIAVSELLLATYLESI